MSVFGIQRLGAGDLNKKIIIRRATETDNGKGGYTTAWATIASPWAEVIGLDGREAVIGQALQGVSYYRIRIRFRADIRPADQIQYKDLDLNIRSVSDPRGESEQLLILADTASTVPTN